MVIIHKTETGEYEVVSQDGSGRILHTAPTHAAAWRWIDRQAGEPISPAEKESEWISDKILNGGSA